MNDAARKLLAAASAASAATTDMIEAAREGEIKPVSNVGSGEALTMLADAMRLLMEANPIVADDANQLHGALIRFLEERS
ncbi:hypothetical protein KUV64_13920 [Mameliella alba]|uniref:hypothetical protein n=1 Tax=Mameliella TaxID=1434019 RepID=UPI001C98E1B5|nr:MULTISPECIES: hypothetical protein [Mameliella]MBY6120230.1 hypothetical protein [Mameliella alba]MDD9733135.1 hypothetical protein [Mameliella sp. AT18]